MAKMTDAVWAQAATLAARWLCAVVLIVIMFGRAAAVSVRRRVSTWSTSAGRLPPVGQQLLDPTVQLRRQAREDVFQVGPRVVPVELGRLQQAHHHSGPLAGQLTADEQPIAPPEGPRPYSVLAVVIVQRHIAVEQEAPEPLPALQAVVNRLGDRAAIGHTRALELQPQMQPLPHRLGSLLPYPQPLLAGQLPHLGFDLVQPGDALDRLGGDRARVGYGLDEFVELASGVSEAIGGAAPLERQHAVITPIGVDHERAAPTLEELGRVLACLLYTSPSPRDRTRSRMP